MKKIYSKAITRIIAPYVLFGALWILLSDKLLEKIVQDPAVRVQLSIYKGWAYVFVTGLLLYFLLHSLLRSREKVYDALHESEEKYRIIASNMADVVSVLDMSLNCTYMSPSIEKFRGFTVEEAMGQSLDQVMTPESFQRVSKVIEEEMKLELGGNANPDRTRMVEVEEYKKDGTTIWVEIMSSLLRDKDQKATGILSVSRDISDRKRVEITLRESEANLRKSQEIARVGSWLYEFKDPIKWTEETYRIYGVSPETFEPNNRSLSGLIHPDDRDAVETSLKECIENGKPMETEFRCIRPDGTIRYLSELGQRVGDAEGRPLYISGTVQDITERKLGELERERLMAAVEQANETICVTDVLGTIEYVNPAFEKVSGYSRKEALGQIVFFNKSDEQGDDFYKDLWAKISRGDIWQGRLTNKRKDGKPFTESVTISPVHDANGHISNYVAVKRDISEHLLLEVQVQQSMKMEAIGVLAGGVAHDFNNLLTVINGYTDILMQNYTSQDPQFKELGQIKKAGQQAASLTSQLLAFSRKQMMQSKILNLNEVVSETGNMLSRLIGEDIELNTIRCPGLGMVHADPGQIQQVIMNLAVNARDAMPQGGRLTIETANVVFDDEYLSGHPVAKAGPYIMLAVSDNGMGMDEETQAHIFEPFYTTKGKNRGTGLGLSTAYGIVKQSKGFIWVYSELAKGTTFKIYLPQINEQTIEHENEKLEDRVHCGSDTILIVEDNESVRKLICRIIQKHGNNIFEAANGNDAVNFVKEYAGEIHLVVTDVIMPGMSGMELRSKLEVLRPGIKTLFVSGYTDNAIVNHGILDSESAFLQKPFTADGLIRKMREVMDSPSL